MTNKTIKKTQVCIIGSGPAGLLLSQLLHNQGISSIIIDNQTREHIEGRIRAGVLEWGSVEVLEEAGVGERMNREGLIHDGFELSFEGDRHRIDLKALTGKSILVYGQTEITHDLIEHRLDQGCEIVFAAKDVQPFDIFSDQPKVQFSKNDETFEITCNYIAGCDGFHGISRKSIPSNQINNFERIYPFGWLGILVDKPPISEELIYLNHQRGFALCSMRSHTRSRYYLQCPLSDSIDDWSDQQFWDELKMRLGSDISKNLQIGESIEKSIAPLRSFVVEPMRYGNLFLAGDAAHIVPPTGAKGLNLAVSDVKVLANALAEHYHKSNDTYLERYSNTCLKRIWHSEHFSWSMSIMMHQLPDFGGFEKRMQRAEFDYLIKSETASKLLAEGYVGLPIEI